jgi:hypothetical protein
MADRAAYMREYMRNVNARKKARLLQLERQVTELQGDLDARTGDWRAAEEEVALLKMQLRDAHLMIEMLGQVKAHFE